LNRYIPVFLDPNAELAIIVPPASISLELICAREDGVIVRASYGGHELARERFYHFGDT
jgi:hypothetical protein